MTDTYKYVVEASDYKRMERELADTEEENAALTEELVKLRKQVAEMEDDVKLLRALQAGGVDNWEWYDASLENMED